MQIQKILYHLLYNITVCKDYQLTQNTTVSPTESTSTLKHTEMGECTDGWYIHIFLYHGFAMLSL